MHRFAIYGRLVLATAEHGCIASLCFVIIGNSCNVQDVCLSIWTEDHSHDLMWKVTDVCDPKDCPTPLDVKVEPYKVCCCVNSNAQQSCRHCHNIFCQTSSNRSAELSIGTSATGCCAHLRHICGDFWHPINMFDSIPCAMHLLPS